MHIILRELLKNQRFLGEAIGIITGLYKDIKDEEVKSRIKKYIDTASDFKFSKEFWEEILKYEEFKRNKYEKI